MLIPALKVALILAAVLVANRLALRLLRTAARRSEFLRTSGGVLRGLVQGFILGVGALIILDTLGISITPILASLGVGSLAVALALQDTLANFFAGLYILADRPVRAGDVVRLEQGGEGVVAHIGWRSTRIRLLPDNLVVLPNTKITSSVIVNYSLPTPELSVAIPLQVHAQSDLERVERVTLEVARQVMETVPGAVPGVAPVFRCQAFGESGIACTVVLRSRRFAEQDLLRHEFIKRLQARYREEGIALGYPTRTVDLPRELVASLRGMRG